MRLHAAAAFVLSRGLGPATTTTTTTPQLPLDVMPFVPSNHNSNRNRVPALHMVDPKLTGKVADAFKEMNDEMTRRDDELLKSLSEISDSFKRLANADFPGLFHRKDEESPANGAAAPPVNGAAVPAPANGAAFAAVSPMDSNAVEDPPVNGAHVPEATGMKRASETAQPSFMASLKKNAQFGGQAAATPPSSGSVPASYMDSLSSASNAAPTMGARQAAAAASSSYLDALRPVPDPTVHDNSSPSSYLDSMVKAASMGPPPAMKNSPQQQQQQQQQKSPPVESQLPYSPPRQQQPAKVEPAPPKMAATSSQMPYSPPSPPKQQQQASQLPYAPPTQQQQQPASSASHLPYSPPPPQQQQKAKPPPAATQLPYAPPRPQQQQQMQQQPPPQAETYETPPIASQRAVPPPPTVPEADRKMIVEQPPAKVQRIATRAEVLDFGPDHEDMMGAGSAPIIRNPSKARHVVPPAASTTHPNFVPDFDDFMHSESLRSFPPPHVPQEELPKDRISIGATKSVQAPPHVPQEELPKDRISIGATKSFQAPPHVPQEELPKDRISIGATKMSGYVPGIEAPGMSGQAQHIPDPTPKPPLSPFAKRVNGLDQMNEQAPRVPDPAPKPPISPFAQKVSGMEGMSERAPTQPVPKPKAQIPVFAQKVPGWDDVSNVPPVSEPPPIEPPMSVFCKKISGMQGMLEEAPRVPQPKPKAPMSVFSQKVSAMEGMTERAPNAPQPKPKPKPEPPMSVFSQKIPGLMSDMEHMSVSNGARMVPPPPPPSAGEPRISVAARKVSGMPDHTAPNPEWYEIQKPSQPVSVFAKKVSGLMPDNDSFVKPGREAMPQPKPEPPMSVFSKRINSNVPRVVAPNNGEAVANDGSAPRVPQPKPLHAKRPYQAVTGVTEAPGFSLNHEDAISAGYAPKVVPPPPSTGWDGPPPESFEVGPDFP